MGATYSYLELEAEKLTWNYHCLLFDENTRSINLKLINQYFPDGSVIVLGETDVHNGGLDYKHFFITDTEEAHFLELSDNAASYELNRVQCNTLPHGKYTVCNKKELTAAMKERMIQMMGMCNYSLCLRNSEHVANYIFSGTWASLQMENEGVLSSYFSEKMTEDQRKKINTFPSAISPKTVADDNCSRLYSMIDKQYTPTKFQYFSSGNDESYNVLVAGPTGAGKSRLINVLFNREICDSFASHESVTKDVCFIEGDAEIVNLKTKEKEMKKIVVADTVGLCDTEWDDDTIFQLLKGRVSRNFHSINAVFIVFRADRLLKEHVKNITKVMDWLGYNDNHLNFLFVGTCAENLTSDDKERLKKQARTILKLKDTKTGNREYDSLVYVGFPPENNLNDDGKIQVKASWELLQPLMRLCENGEQLENYRDQVDQEKAWYQKIPLPKLSSSCTIL